MGKLFQRLLERIWFFVTGVLNIGISLKAVVLLLALGCGGTYAWVRSDMLKAVGGKEDYADAMRYIEMKDLLDERFIDAVDRKSLGDAASAAMVADLGDGWSYFMSADEYRTYQLSSDQTPDAMLETMATDYTDGETGAENDLGKALREVLFSG